MNYCQFRNDFIKRMANAGGGGLPEEYQAVEYLKSNGGQHIDTTVNPASGATLKIQIKFSGGDFDYTAIMGSQGTYRTAVLFGYASNNLGVGNGNMSATSTQTKFNSTSTNTLEFTINDTTRTISGVHNGVTLSDTSYSNTYSGRSIYLFANNYTSGLQKSKASVYYWRCYINNVLTRDFIPCYRKADNKPGMYDLVTNTFFTNAGTGEFTIGNTL